MPVIYIGSTPNVIAVNQKIGVNSLQSLLDMARATPGVLDFATAGHGTTQHLSGEMLKTLAKVDIKHVPYKGGGPAAADVIAGHVPVLISGCARALPSIKAGSLTALAVTSDKRSPILPDVPTVAEAGFAGFESTFWFAVLAPRDTPKSVIDELNKVFRCGVQASDVRQQLAQLGVDITGGTPHDAAEFMKADAEKWAKLVKSTGMKLMD